MEEEQVGCRLVFLAVLVLLLFAAVGVGLILREAVGGLFGA